MTDFVDPEELPFTAEELFLAARGFLPEDAARDMANHLAECGLGLIVAREERRATWRAAGMVEAHWMPLHGLSYPAELLPALAALSPDAEARALFLMEERWRGVYRVVVSQMQRQALRESGVMPSDEEIIRRANEAATTKRAKRSLRNGLVVQGPPPPLPTTAMVTAAHAAVAREREAWHRDVERFRTSRSESA